MTVISLCLDTLAGTAPSPPSPDAQTVKFIIDQVEHFYGEMFLGMTAIYALITAIFGYLLPKQRLKSLHKKVQGARAAAQHAVTTIDQKLASAKEEVAVAVEQLRHLTAAVMRFNTGLLVYASGARKVEIASMKSGSLSQNPDLIPASKEMLIAAHEFFAAGDRRAFGVAVGLSIIWLKEHYKFAPIPSDRQFHALIAQTQKEYSEAINQRGWGETPELQPSEQLDWFLGLGCRNEAEPPK